MTSRSTHEPTPIDPEQPAATGGDEPDAVLPPSEPTTPSPGKPPKDKRPSGRHKRPAGKARRAAKVIAETAAIPSLHESQRAVPILSQVAALPLRTTDEGRMEICLITTRETHRWTIPKGWPMSGLKDHRAAALEAEQEAGLRGRIGKQAVGTYLSFKRQETHFDLVTITVYRLDVTRILATWREKGQRQIIWVPPHVAYTMVEETGLQAIIAALIEDPSDLRPS